MRCSNSTRYAVLRDLRRVYDGLACCKTLDGPKGDGSLSSRIPASPPARLLGAAELLRRR